MTDGDIWAGLACLKAKPDAKNFRRFGDGKGAYVNVVAWAESKAAFEEKIRRHVDELDCILVELEQVQLVEERMKAPGYSEELIGMRQTALREPSNSVFGTFHIWHQNDAN